jgi:UPF0716 protein FxsA
VVAALALLFLVVPIAELYVIVKVAGAFGVLQTLLLLVAVSAVGAWLVKREGLGLIRRVQQSLARGELPHREVVDGFLILLAGALMLTPGFLSDVLGLLLLFPPTRAVARVAIYRRFRSNIIEVDARERSPGHAARPEIDP